MGESALRISGCSAMPRMPQAAIVEEPDDHHRAEQPPDRAGAEPLDANRHDDDRRGDRDDQVAERGATTLSPSTAESTEIAGVIMLSPKNSEAPKIPSAASTILVRAAARQPCAGSA